jgi:hypothetical protein
MNQRCYQSDLTRTCMRLLCQRSIHQQAFSAHHRRPPYLQCPDPNTPVEVRVGAMPALVKESTEVSASCMRWAHTVQPIAAIQVDAVHRPRARDHHRSVLAARPELAHWPVWQDHLDDFGLNDPRRMLSQPSRKNFSNTRGRQCHEVDRCAPPGDCAAVGHVSLALMLAQGPDVVPIARTTNIDVSLPFFIFDC